MCACHVCEEAGLKRNIKRVKTLHIHSPPTVNRVLQSTYYLL